MTVGLISCQQDKTYLISGELTGFPDSTMFYLRNLNSDELFDSALIVKNRIVFKGKLLDEPEQIWLKTNIDNQLIYTNLLIGNEKVAIKGDKKDFPWNVQITGSKTQDDFNYLQKLTNPNEIERNSLATNFFKLPAELQQEQGKATWSKIKTLDEATQSIQVGYLKSHLNTYQGVITLGYLKNSLPKDTVQALFNKLTTKLKSSKYAKSVEVFLTERISKIGDISHDFIAYTKDGAAIKFSEIKGSYILLDFTSASCAPCILSVEELRRINNTYSDSLVIVSYSIDAKKDNWLKSLKRDNITWISLWDGKGTFSETYLKYGVQGYPTFFLIDPNKKIIDKWAGYGAGSLEKKLNRFKKA